MISMHLNMITKPGKCREFKQTMDYMITQYDKIEGCSGFEFRQNDSDDDHFYVHAKWQDLKGLKLYLLSDQFMLLQGAIAVLCNPPEMEISDGTILKKIDFDDRDNEYRKGQTHDKLNAALMELNDNKNIF